MRLPTSKYPVLLITILALGGVLTPSPAALDDDQTSLPFAAPQQAAPAVPAALIEPLAPPELVVPQCSDVAFVPNQGQWQSHVAFMARTGPMTTWFTDGGWTFTLQEPIAAGQENQRDSRAGVAVAMSFVGAAEGVTPVGAQPHGSRHSFYRDGTAVAGVSAWSQVRYDELYAGVDVVVRPHDGRLEYDVMLAPGADLSAVAVQLEGAEGYSIREDGALVMETALGPVIQPAPRTWAVMPDGTQSDVQCRFRRIDDTTYGFAAPGWNRDLPLVVDPAIVWATFLGGNNFDYVQAVVADDAGMVTVAGFTTVTGFPTTTGAFDTSFNGNRDIFVARLSAAGDDLLFSTYLGGSGNEETLAMASMRDGGVVLTGWTSSVNFPTTSGAYRTQHAGGGPFLGSDAFVSQLSPSGGQLLYSTYLGGSSDDTGTAIDVNDAGVVTVAGRTASINFPTTFGAVDRVFSGGTAEVGDMFVTRFTPSGSGLDWSTYVGGTGNDNANSLCVDSQGRAVVAGWSMSPDYPTTAGAYDTTLGGFSDAVMTRIAADGKSFDLSTFIGGYADENATTLWIDGLDRLLLAGTTLSGNFPTTANAASSAYAGGAFYGDVFVSCFDVDGTTLEYSTYLGGSGDDFPTALRTDEFETLHVSGWTVSSDFPVTPDALDDSLGGSTDAFYANISGDTLITATYLGGNSPDKSLAMWVSSAGRVTLAGWTTSGAFPVTSGSLDDSFGGIEGFISDAFVARLEVGNGSQALGSFAALGFDLVGFAGLAPVLEWNGSMLPDSFGQVNFSGVRPNAQGFIFMGYTPGAMPFGGGTFVPFPYVTLNPIFADAAGSTSLNYHWPVGVPPDLTFYVQAWFLDADGPVGYSATEAWQLITP